MNTVLPVYVLNGDDKVLLLGKIKAGVDARILIIWSNI